MASPSVDVLVPVYNNVDYLWRCVESAAEQVHPPRRVICVNDASTDSRVPTILSSLSERHPCVQIIEMDSNRGICAAQNRGVEVSEADYVAFLDCDDWLREDALALVVRSLAENPAEYVFTDRIDVHMATTEQFERTYGGQPHLRQRSHYSNLLDHMVASHLKVISREALLETGGFSPGTEGVQDWDMALRLSEQVKLAYVPEAVYFHRVHGSQDSVVNHVENIRRTNQVRRAAQERRYGASPQAATGAEPRLPAFHNALAMFNAETSSHMERTDVLLAMDADDKIHMLPQTRACVGALLEHRHIKEILIFGFGSLYLEMLKDLWAAPERPMLGMYLPCGNGDFAALDSIRWSNSYFDYVASTSPFLFTAMSGYAHRDLRLLTSSKDLVCFGTWA